MRAPADGWYRVNIANGKVFNLAEDLRLQKTEYNTCLVIYFISYVIFDIPMTLLIRVIKPHIYRMLAGRS